MGMGYQGFVKFYKTGGAMSGAGPSDPLLLLANGASVNQVLEPIFSTAVWGAGWYNAPTSAHYADAAIHYEGTVDFEMQASDDIWDFIGDFAINDRAYPRSLDISPDGARVFEYHTTGSYNSTYDTNGAWCSELSMNTAEGAFVTASVGVWALIRDQVDPIGGHAFSNYSYINQKTGVVGGDTATFAATNPLNPSGANVDPIPFWKTNAQLLYGTYVVPFSGGSVIQASLETVEWNTTVTNNIIALYTCNGTRLPSAILQGPIDGSASVTLYHPTGVIDPILGSWGGSAYEGTLTSPFLYAENTWFRVTIAKAVPVYMELPAVVVQNDDYGLKGQSDVTNRTFDLKAMGGRIGAYSGSDYLLPPVILSDSSGVYVTP